MATGFFRNIRECEQISADFGNFFGARMKELYLLFKDKDFRQRLKKDRFKFFGSLLFGAVFAYFFGMYFLPYLTSRYPKAGIVITVVSFAAYKYLSLKQSKKNSGG